MPDLKISQLTGGGAAQAADEFPNARSGANFKITGANIAAAATSVGTLTSLTVSGDLTVDTSTLKVDSANNQVGIGTATPGASLHVAGAISAAPTGLGFLAGIQGNFAVAHLNGTDGSLIDFSVSGTDTRGRIIYTNSTNAMGFGTTDGVTKMTLDGSGNLGLGVTPSAWGSSYRAVQIGSLTAGSLFAYSNALEIGTNFYFDTGYKYGGTGSATRYVQNSGAHSWFNAPSGTAGNAITFTQAMTLDASGRLGIGTTSPGARLHVSGGRTYLFSGDNYSVALAQTTPQANYVYLGTDASGNFLASESGGSTILTLTQSGNLGLGVTPSAWASDWKVAQLGARGFVGYYATTPSTFVGYNTYYAGTSGTSPTYIATAAASLYQQVGAVHNWFNAVSGTAGNNISFTQRMTLDASGNLGVGTTTFGTSAAKVLGLGNATEPSTAVADTIQFYSVDLSAGNTIPAIYCEGTGVTGAAITNVTVTNKIAIKVNGTVYYLLATTSAA